LDSLRGKLLLSGGGLYDDNFRHTVVLIGAHGEEGAAGVILNRPMDLLVQASVPALAELTGEDATLFGGGPVEPGEAVLLVAVADPGILDIPIFGSVGFLTGDVPADAAAAIRHARVFLGHAGWGPGQLEDELRANAWIVEPATEDDVFTADPRSLWRRILQRKGPPFANLARVPYDPRTN
jgi:putative transcriptional regulator